MIKEKIIQLKSNNQPANVKTCREEGCRTKAVVAKVGEDQHVRNHKANTSAHLEFRFLPDLDPVGSTVRYEVMKLS